MIRNKINGFLKEGDVQIIRAGNGISHAEEIDDNSEIFQIWFDPNLSKTLKISHHMMIINQISLKLMFRKKIKKDN